MNRLPRCCLSGCLWAQNVSCFAGGNSHSEIRKHSLENPVNVGATGFPALATCHPLGNIKFPVGFLEGFL